MADILDYTQNTNPSGTDATYLVDDASGTPADNYIDLHDIAKGINHVVEMVLVDAGTAPTTGDDMASTRLIIPTMLNGYNLSAADVALSVASTSGNPTFQIYNVTQAADMLSTLIKCDTGELTSYTASTGSVIDTANDDVATGDQLRVDCDAKGSVAVKGTTIILEFTKP